MTDIEPGYDEVVAAGIVQSLKEGMIKLDAAEYNGISEVTFYRWMKNADFKDMVRKAILEYKRSLIITMNIGAIKSWRAALEVLQRRWPGDWNLTKKVHITNPDEELKRVMRIIMGTATPEDLPDMSDEIQEQEHEDLPDIPE